MSTWFRFMTQSGTVYGEVLVPGTPPRWFEPILREMNEGRTGRDISISDFTPEEWVDTLCSVNRPIPLRKPLSPQPQEELLFFAEGRLEAMKEAIKQMGSRRDADGKEIPGIPAEIILRDDDFVRKFAVFMEDFEKVPPDERKNYRPLPRKSVQKDKGRTFVNYVPLMDPDSEDEALESYVLFPHQIASRVTVKLTDKWRSMVQGIYGGLEIAQSSDVPRLVPRA